MICWLDLETAGSTPDVDYVLEIGAVMTTDTLTELSTLRTLVRPPDALLLWDVDPIVLEMHSANGLWSDVFARGTDVANADRIVSEWLREVSQGAEIRLAGSGVSHFDHDVIRRRLPLTWARLDGYNDHVKPTIDVGVIRRFLKTTGLEHLVPDLGDIPHRALDDAQRFVTEAREYRRIFSEPTAVTIAEPGPTEVDFP